MSRQGYRLLYSILALLLTLLWILYIHFLPDGPLYHIAGGLSWLMVAAQMTGLLITLISLKSFDAGEFLGFKQDQGEPEPFHEQGIYRHIRHPMYTGIMLALLASPVQTINSLNLAVCISLYFMIGSRFEERRMIQLHPEYLDYIQRVPGFLPWRALFHRARRSQ